ncbi:molybdopterin molybdotransferase MoeA [Vreelandella sp. EE22]
MTLSCFELEHAPLSVEKARQALTALITCSVGVEDVSLEAAHGRLLAAPVTASINVPRHTNAALDGIALAWSDATRTHWPLAGSAFAGQAFEGAPAPGECVRITTGAPLPPGTDTVIASEQLEEHGSTVTIQAPERVEAGQNVRQAGEDIAVGSTVLAAGARLDAASLGLIASLGFARVSVIKRPVVALFSTGNEVTAPGKALPHAGIFDANRFTLMGLLHEHGATALDLGILPDDADVIEKALGEAAAKSDLVLTSAGVSAGPMDFTRVALERLGRLVFWQVALRPGKPMACGYLGENQTPFVGLPGNPVAAMVTFHQFVAPLLKRLQGQVAHPPKRLRAVLETPLEGRLARTDLIRGVYRCDVHGTLHVRTTGAQGSGMLTSMVTANCLIELDADQDAAAPGDIVLIQPLSEAQSPALL